jgi:hypothetical protein
MAAPRRDGGSALSARFGVLLARAASRKLLRAASRRVETFVAALFAWQSIEATHGYL